MEGATYPFTSINDKSASVDLDWVDYTVFGSVLSLTLLVAVFHGFTRRDKESSEEFLMGYRNMSIVPVGLSLISGCISAVTIVGAPLEVYLYGAQFGVRLLSLLPVAIVMIYLYIPVYFNMELDSPIQYFQRRFSRSVQIFVATLSLVQMIFYMPLVVHMTASYLEQVSGISCKLLGALIFSVCIITSFLSGFTGVIWTTSIQMILVLGLLVVLVVLGFLELPDTAWEEVTTGDLMKHFNFTPDPRYSHTLWTSLIAVYFIWISTYAGSQYQIQRLMSLPNIRKARRAAALSIWGLGLLLTLCVLVGNLLLRKYSTCNPSALPKNMLHETELFTNFVLSIIGKFPGLLGLVLGTIAGPCIGTVSGTLNSMVSLVAYDFLPFWIPNITQQSLILLSKILNFLFGGIAFGLFFVVQNMETVLTTGWTVCCLILGLTYGLYTLGMFFPFVNSKGSIMGMLGTLAFCTYTVLLPLQLEQDGHVVVIANASSHVNSPDGSDRSISISGPLASTEAVVGGMVMSPMWYATVGCLGTILLGLLFSLLFLRWHGKLVSPECFSPPILSLWIKRLPSKVGKWIGPDDNLFLISSASLSFPFWPRKDDDLGEKDAPRCDVEITLAYELTL